MIDVLPEIYEDELFYSWLARCYVRNCYPDYKMFSHQVMGRRDTNPNFEFINAITDNERPQIIKHFGGSISNILNNHTLIPYYSCFIDDNKRKFVYERASTENLSFDKLLSLPNLQKPKYLQYCPECVNEDRRKKGETYWRRIHQINIIKVCPVHKCHLCVSDVQTNGKIKGDMQPAETAIKDVGKIITGNNREIELAKYIKEILDNSCYRPQITTMSAGRVLSIKMQETKYVSRRGNKRKVSMLHQDLVDYWGEELMMPLYEMKKVLRGINFQTSLIVLLAIYLKVPAPDLVMRNIKEGTRIEEFDNRVIELYKSGKSISSIAYTMKLSQLTINHILEKGYLN